MFCSESCLFTLCFFYHKNIKISESYFLESKNRNDVWQSCLSMSFTYFFIYLELKAQFTYTNYKSTNYFELSHLDKSLDIALSIYNFLKRVAPSICTCIYSYVYLKPTPVSHTDCVVSFHLSQWLYHAV